MTEWTDLKFSWFYIKRCKTLMFTTCAVFFRREVLQTHHFPQKMSSLNQVSNAFIIILFIKAVFSHRICIFLCCWKRQRATCYFFLQKHLRVTSRPCSLIAAVWYLLTLLEQDFSHRLVSKRKTGYTSLWRVEPYLHTLWCCRLFADVHWVPESGDSCLFGKLQR